MKTLTWTLDSLNEFKIKFNTAVENKEESFIFKENEFLTAYAEYLIEFLETTLKK